MIVRKGGWYTGQVYQLGRGDGCFSGDTGYL